MAKLSILLKNDQVDVVLLNSTDAPELKYQQTGLNPFL